MSELKPVVDRPWSGPRYGARANHVIPGQRRGVYFLRSGAFLKVGMTTDLASRMKAFQSTIPHELELLLFVEAPTNRTREQITFVEKSMHQAWNAFHHRGEWFYLANVQPSLNKIVELTSTAIDGWGMLRSVVEEMVDDVIDAEIEQEAAA